MNRSQRIGRAWMLIATIVVSGCAKQPETSAIAPPAAPVAIPSGTQTETAAPAATDATTDVAAPAAPVVEASTPPAATSESTTASAEASKPAAGFYSVAVYNESQDPAGDLAATIERATVENKRILIQVGGEWCIWCHRISDYMETNEKVRKLTDDHFIVMKVTYPAAKVDSFLEQYPRVEAYPHLFVLEPDGTFLHSQGTSELELEKGYNEEVFCQFLNDWVKQ
jgi:hypothetical protein